MSIEERELRSRLTETATLAGAPGFTMDELAGRVRRIRRRRRGRAAIIAAVSVAAVASAVAIPLTRGGTGQPVMSAPPPPPPGLSYTVTANGQTRAVPATGRAPLFTITPGQRLTMTVKVTVPGPQAMTALWLGITNNILAPRPGGPADMTPILAASTRKPLRQGAHRFTLHWTVPAGLKPGTSRQLSVEWSWSGPEPGQAERIVAIFAVPLPPGAASSGTVALRLRALALHAVAICDGARPDWIRAVRTTFSKAMAAVGGHNDIADNPADVVYVVLMKGDFTFYNGDPSCRYGPIGRYYSAVFDAATFLTLEAGIGPRSLPVPLHTLGPVLNITLASSRPSARRRAGAAGEPKAGNRSLTASRIGSRLATDRRYGLLRDSQWWRRRAGRTR